MDYLITYQIISALIPLLIYQFPMCEVFYNETLNEEMFYADILTNDLANRCYIMKEKLSKCVNKVNTIDDFQFKYNKYWSLNE